MNVRRASKFVALNGSNANVDRQSVELLFRGEDGGDYAIELAPDVITPMVLTIVGHAIDLLANLPQGETLPTQALIATKIEIAMNPVGDLAWKMTLQSGLALAYQISKDEFRALETTVAEMRLLMDRKAH